MANHAAARICYDIPAVITWDTFLDRLRARLDAHALLAPRAAWVVGASGGADSTALLLALHRLSRRESLEWSLHAAHLHHGLRGEDADEDAAYVQRLADGIGAAFHVDRINVRERVSVQGGSTEEVARQSRYEFLERVALTAGSTLVAVAHHADDNAETVLHRICRGTGLRGLGGMPAVRPIRPGSSVRLVRPMLEERRATIDGLLAVEGIKPRQDATNLTGEFTRGRIRNAIMPLLREQLNPNTSESLLRLAEQARWLGTYLEDAAARTFESLVISDGPAEVVLNVRALLSKQKIIQAEVVRRAVSIALRGEQDLGFNHVDSVLDLAAEGASGKELHLPGPVLVRKVYERLVFRPLEDESDAAPADFATVVLACPGVTAIPALRAEACLELCDSHPDQIAELRSRPHPGEEWIDFDRISPPLLVRARQAGDRFWPLGAPGAKTVSDFLGDVKLDPRIRARVGILCDQNGPVWVMPLRIDERVKLRPTTRRVLRVVLRSAGREAATP